MLTQQPAAQCIKLWPIDRLIRISAQSTEKRRCGGSHVRFDPRVRLQDSRASPQQRRSRGWPPSAQSGAKLGVQTPCEPVATWADFDEELLALELQEIQEADFDLSLTTDEITVKFRLRSGSMATSALAGTDMHKPQIGDKSVVSDHTL